MLADYARYDLPAIAAFVREQTAQGAALGRPTRWAARRWRPRWVAATRAEEAASAALFGTQISRIYWPSACCSWSGSRLLLKGFHHISGARFSVAPGRADRPGTGEPAPASAVRPLPGERLERDWWAGMADATGAAAGGERRR